MSIARHHAEWLSLIDVSGPILSMPVLMRVFPQGLEAHDPDRFRTLRIAYEEWEDDQSSGKANPAIHIAWIRFVLADMLDLNGEVLAEGQGIPQTLQVNGSFPGEVLRPTMIVKNPTGHPQAGTPRLLIQTYPLSQNLDKAVRGSKWKSSPGDRMIEMLQGSGVRLGLVTNGERWMLVDAPKNETHCFASWYSHLWLEESITLQAFRSLLSADRFFNASEKDTLEALLAESASNQQEVTDQLGYQVRRAVEVLVQSFDRADQDHDRRLLGSVSEAELYEAALTVMMRLVFMFCAEERKLFPLNNDFYGDHYALSTIREQLRRAADQHGEEILERRYDAWCRLLSTFRAVYGGVRHDRFCLPAYGGNLFDPDRFPFLEGRKADTSWQDTQADPLPVSNRTVLHLLEALQLLQMKVPGGGPVEARRLSFLALDIEQIGHVYEGLLDHTAKRATEPVLGLSGAKDKEPEIPLSKLEAVRAKGDEALAEYLRKETGRSEKALAKALKAEPDMLQVNRLQAACGGDGELWGRIRPFAGVIRDDTFGYPVVITKGSVYVTAGTDRRSSGTHYTPPKLTQPIVRYTLEPLVYVGPAEGKPDNEWVLRPPAELLDLKICDMACGSGAFLVEACRYMSKRLVEAWEEIEQKSGGKVRILPDGKVSQGKPTDQPIPLDADERMAYARRIVAQRCLYGVDINPLACEMAKLSLWLLTLAKDKPFTFLDHAMRCGDSLVGIHTLDQLKNFNLDPAGGKQYLFTEPLETMVDEAVALRLKIEQMPANTVEDVETQKHLLDECEEKMSLLKSAADMLISAEFKPGNASERQGHRDHAAVVTGQYLKEKDDVEFSLVARNELNGRRPLHWPLEFPEVFEGDGFHVFVGNPPFMGGRKITTNLGGPYLSYLLFCRDRINGIADLVCHFFRRAFECLRVGGVFGLVATNSIAEVDSRVGSLEPLVADGGYIFRAHTHLPWPGQAAVIVSTVYVANGFSPQNILNGDEVSSISPSLTEGERLADRPLPLVHNRHLGHSGSKIMGDGFKLSQQERDALLGTEPPCEHLLKELLGGADINDSVTHAPSRFVIDPGSMDETQISQFPAIYRRLREMVYPSRSLIKDTAKRKYWWRFAGTSDALYESITGMEACIACSRVAKYVMFALIPTQGAAMQRIFDESVVVLALDRPTHLALLQSSLHTCWVDAWGSKMGSAPRYTATEVLETFPFPTSYDSLNQIGQAYISQRAYAMGKAGSGLTATYNRFHNPDEAAEDIQKLRELHVEMDKAVASAYGWNDLDLGHGFHETKQGTRFTISEPARREVLARLLKLNHERYAEEVAAGLHEKKNASARGAKRKRGPNVTDAPTPLFE